MSDVEMDLTEFLVHDEDEVRQKEQIWDTMNADYLQKQELKRLQLEEAHQVGYKSYLVAGACFACRCCLLVKF